MKIRIVNLITGIFAVFGFSAQAQTDYGLPSQIQDGNILHCFDWKMSDIKKNLPGIAEAGFVAVQISPQQRTANSGANWSDPYRPFDFKFRVNGMGSADDLTALCEEADKYGIKIIVDVVFNHVDKGSYHDKWWNENGRLRSGTSYINYSNRNSITHDLMGDFPDVNTEDPDVIARAKAYIEELKAYGVKGIRFDAAKHIGLPSEGSDFWKEVTSVPDMFYYGEILDSPGGSATKLMEEYTEYMSVTDSQYSTTTRGNRGVPSTRGNWNRKGIDGRKLIYWGESHDTYANTPDYGGVTKNTDQNVIDRAYAILACRDEGVALYFSRPSAKDFGQIKVGQKGSTHFTSPEVAEVNKFKNAMVGRAESYSQNGAASSLTREGGGAVIVKKTGSGSVSVPNGDSFCPEGKYYDRISGNEFTVTATTISGEVGETGIAVIYSDPENGNNGVGAIEDEFNGEGSIRWFTLQGISIAEPTSKGIYIKMDSRGKSKKVFIP